MSVFLKYYLGRVNCTIQSDYHFKVLQGNSKSIIIIRIQPLYTTKPTGNTVVFWNISLYSRGVFK